MCSRKHRMNYGFSASICDTLLPKLLSWGVEHMRRGDARVLKIVLGELPAFLLNRITL